jgi:hypothetical protein
MSIVCGLFRGARIVLVTLLALLACAAPAQAAFPGANGKILFTRWPPPGNQGN